MKHPPQIILTPVSDIKRSSTRSSVFKTIKKSLSTSSLSHAFTKCSRTSNRVSPTNIYGDNYSLDIAPLDILEEMLRADLKTVETSDCSPYSNGAIQGLRSTRSAFSLSTNYRSNASTIPTLFVKDTSSYSSLTLKSASRSPRSRPTPSPDFAEKPTPRSPLSTRPRTNTSITTYTYSTTSSKRSAVYSPRTPTEEEKLTSSPRQQWFDDYSSRADGFASKSATYSSKETGDYGGTFIRTSTKPPYTALSTKVSDLEKRYEERYGQKPSRQRVAGSLGKSSYGSQRGGTARYTFLTNGKW